MPQRSTTAAYVATVSFDLFTSNLVGNQQSSTELGTILHPAQALGCSKSGFHVEVPRNRQRSSGWRRVVNWASIPSRIGPTQRSDPEK